MKSKLRPVFLFRALALTPLFSQSISAQFLYWAAPVDELANRNGVWSLNTPNWARSPGAPPSTPWNNIGSFTAVFEGPEGANATTASLIRLRGIETNTEAPVTIGGPAPLNFIGSTTIRVTNAPLFIEAPVSYPLAMVSKLGLGHLEIRGVFNPSLFSIQEGLVSISGGNVASNVDIFNRSELLMLDSDTITDYSQAEGGFLGGSGTLTATGGATLSGGEIGGILSANTVVNGNVLASGSLIGSGLSINSGTLTLTGSTTHSLIRIASGATLLNVSGRLDAVEAGIDNLGTIRMDADDTIHDYSQENGSLLSGNGLLTVGKAIFLNGGTVEGKLSGYTQVNGNVNVTGALSGPLLEARSGILTLAGTADHSKFVIKSPATVENINSGLGANTDLTNSGSLVLHKDDTVRSYTQTSGSLGGSGNLAVTNNIHLLGGTVAAGLSGKNIFGNGDVLITGHIGAERMELSKGTMTIEGQSSAGKIELRGGDLILAPTAAVSPGVSIDLIEGTLTNHANSMVDYYRQSGGSITGGGTLTSRDGFTITGGSVSGKLSGDVYVTGFARTEISSRITGGQLKTGHVAELHLTGSSGHREIVVSGSSALRVENGGLDSLADVTNQGTIILAADDEVAAYHQDIGGILDGPGTLFVTGGALIRAGLIAGNLHGDLTASGGRITGRISGGTLNTERDINGRILLTGTSEHGSVDIGAGSTLIVDAPAGAGLDSLAGVENRGKLDLRSSDQVASYKQHAGGSLKGAGSLATRSGASLHGGIISGTLLSDAVVTGNVLVDGAISGGTMDIRGGTLDLTGQLAASTRIRRGGALSGDGDITGNVINEGSLGIRSGGDRTLGIDGDFTNTGTVSFKLDDPSTYDRLKITGTANFGGVLEVENLGKGLRPGETAQLIEAGAFTGAFDAVLTESFSSAVVFDNTTGMLTGMTSNQTGKSGRYLNLNASQTDIYLSLYEDAIGAGETNVVTGTGAKRKAKAANESSGGIRFLSGISNGDPLLVAALNASILPGVDEIAAPVINRLSPEVHRGMADYTRQSVRSHVREATGAAPLSRLGDTRVFAATHTTGDGVDSSTTQAGYDFNLTGLTTGVRHEIDTLTAAGAFFGVDEGDIEGGLVDTDADSLAFGAFASRVIDPKRRITLHGALAYAAGNFDAERTSFAGDVTADGIDSKVLELSLGASGVAYANKTLTIRPHAELRYAHGSVDSFTESGVGVPLSVARQEIDSWTLDLGVEAAWRFLTDFELIGNLGYMTDFGDSGETMQSSFAASGAGGRRFSVSAPGVDDEGLIIALGLYHDFTDAIRAGLTWRGDIRFGEQDAHTLSLGASFGF